jgi:hypothetical protein
MATYKLVVTEHRSVAALFWVGRAVRIGPCIVLGRRPGKDLEAAGRRDRARQSLVERLNRRQRDGEADGEDDDDPDSPCLGPERSHGCVSMTAASRRKGHTAGLPDDALSSATWQLRVFPSVASLARKPCANPALELTIVSQTGQFLGRNARDARTAGVRVFLDRTGLRQLAPRRIRGRVYVQL